MRQKQEKQNAPRVQPEAVCTSLAGAVSASCSPCVARFISEAGCQTLDVETLQGAFLDAMRTGAPSIGQLLLHKLTSPPTRQILLPAIRFRAFWAVRALLKDAPQIGGEAEEQSFACVLLAERDNSSMTALMYAAYAGEADMVRLLAPYQAGERDIYGQTALVKVLRSSAEKQAKSETAHILAAYPREFTGMEDSWAFLLDREFGITRPAVQPNAEPITDACTRCTCGGASSGSVVEAARMGCAKCLACALENASGSENAEEIDAALESAVLAGHTGCVTLLLDTPCNKMCQQNQNTPLGVAASLGYLGCVQALVSRYKGVKVGEHQRTALMEAAEAGQSAVVRVLLPFEAGITDSHGDTALGAALFGSGKSRDAAGAIRMLLENELEVQAQSGGVGSISAVLLAARRGDQSTAATSEIQRLMAAEDNGGVDLCGRDALFYASALDLPAVVGSILSCADGKAPPRTSADGNSALIVAARRCSSACTKLLLQTQAGYQNNAPGQQGHTSLMKAAFHGSMSCVSVLLQTPEAGRRTPSGLSAAEMAFQAGEFGLARSLLQVNRQQSCANGVAGHDQTKCCGEEEQTHPQVLEALCLRDQRLSQICVQLGIECDLAEMERAALYSRDYGVCTCGAFPGEQLAFDLERVLSHDCVACLRKAFCRDDSHEPAAQELRDAMTAATQRNSWRALRFLLSKDKGSASAPRSAESRAMPVPALRPPLQPLRKQSAANHTDEFILKLTEEAVERGNLACVMVIAQRCFALMTPPEGVTGQRFKINESDVLHKAALAENVNCVKFLLPRFGGILNRRGVSAGSVAFSAGCFASLRVLLTDGREVEAFRPRRHLRCAALKTGRAELFSGLSGRFYALSAQEMVGMADVIRAQGCVCKRLGSDERAVENEKHSANSQKATNSARRVNDTLTLNSSLDSLTPESAFAAVRSGCAFCCLAYNGLCRAAAKGEDGSALLLAVKRGDLQCVAGLLASEFQQESGPREDEKGLGSRPRGKTLLPRPAAPAPAQSALSYALTHSSGKALPLLLASQTETKLLGCTTLMLAALRWDVSAIAKQMQPKAADALRRKDTAGHTAAMYIALGDQNSEAKPPSHRERRIIQALFLAERGIRDNDGNTALALAASLGAARAVDLFLDAERNAGYLELSTKNFLGKLPAQIALDAGYPDIAATLQQANDE